MTKASGSLEDGVVEFSGEELSVPPGRYMFRYMVSLDKFMSYVNPKKATRYSYLPRPCSAY